MLYYNSSDVYTHQLQCHLVDYHNSSALTNKYIILHPLIYRERYSLGYTHRSSTTLCELYIQNLHSSSCLIVGAKTPVSLPTHIYKLAEVKLRQNVTGPWQTYQEKWGSKYHGNVLYKIMLIIAKHGLLPFNCLEKLIFS